MIVPNYEKTPERLALEERIRSSTESLWHSIESGAFPDMHFAKGYSDEEADLSDDREDEDPEAEDPVAAEHELMEEAPEKDKKGEEVVKEDHSKEPVTNGPRIIERIKDLVNRVKTGEDSARAELKEQLVNHPEIWQAVGDLGAHAETTLIELVAQGDPLVKESARLYINQLRNNLLAGSFSQLERLTVQRIIATWLFLQYTDRASLIADNSPAQTNAWAKRQAMAETRYQTALRSLKLVKQLETITAVPVSKTSASTIKHQASSPTAQKDAASLVAGDRPKSDQQDPCKVAKEPSHPTNGHSRRNKFIPKANGKPVNRLSLQVPAYEPLLQTKD